MPDLDQLLDSLVADLGVVTRPPGAAEAVKRARRRRATLVAAPTVAVVALGSALATGTHLDGDRRSPIGEPGSPSPTVVQEGAEAGSPEELEAILSQAPGWAITPTPPRSGYELAFDGPCSWPWREGAVSEHMIGAEGGGESTSDLYFIHREAAFGSRSQAAAAAAELVENLASCNGSWQTQPIAQTGAVLAYSDQALAWVRQDGTRVAVLQLSAAAEPRPPVDVQVEVVTWMIAARGRQQSP